MSIVAEKTIARKTPSQSPVDNLRPQRYAAFPDGDFVDFGLRPVFKEHVGQDGQVYDREVLAGMVETMNHRIANSGDYAAISAGHTPDDPNMPHPALLGFMGPWYLEKFGDVDPEWCIYGRMRIFKDREQEARDRPRVSIEMIPNDDAKKRYFDPVALMGVEAPKLPMGLFYCVARSANVERYSAAFDETKHNRADDGKWTVGRTGERSAVHEHQADTLNKLLATSEKHPKLTAYKDSHDALATIKDADFWERHKGRDMPMMVAKHRVGDFDEHLKAAKSAAKKAEAKSDSTTASDKPSIASTENFANDFHAAFDKANSRGHEVGLGKSGTFSVIAHIRKELPQYSKEQFDAGLRQLIVDDQYDATRSQGGQDKGMKDSNDAIRSAGPGFMNGEEQHLLKRKKKYRAAEAGVKPAEKYSAAPVMPSGSNTFLPSAVSCDKSAKPKDDEKQKYSTENGNMDAGLFSPEQISQLVEAMKPVCQAMVDEATLPEIPAMDEGGIEGEGGAVGDGLDDGSGVVEGEGEAAIEGEDAAAVDAGTSADPVAAEIADDATETPAEDAVAEIEADAADGDVDVEVAEDEAIDLDEKPEKNRYDLEGGNGGGGSGTPVSESELPKVGGKSKSKYAAEKEVTDRTIAANKVVIEKYAAERKSIIAERDSAVEKYSAVERERNDLAEKYSALKAKYATAERDGIKAERYAALKELSGHGYRFDMEEELAEAMNMTAEEWEKHKKRIEKYSRAPIGRNLPIPPPDRYIATDESIEKEKSQKYSVAAQKLVAKYRADNKEISFSEALKIVKEQNGKPEAVAVK